MDWEFSLGLRGIALVALCLGLHTALLFVAVGPWDHWLAIVAFVGLISWTFPLQLFLVWGAHHFRLRSTYVAAGLLAPGPILCSVVFVLAAVTPDPPNQQRRSESPDGRYVLVVDVEERDLDYPLTRFWVVHILRSSDGAEVYSGTSTELGAKWNAYWGWDDEGRVWMYHSDCGNEFYWEEGPDGWEMHQDFAGQPEMPAHARPDYLRDR